MGGEPLSFSLGMSQDIDTKDLKTPDLVQIKKEDAERDTRGKLELFSRYIQGNYDMTNSGSYFNLENGDRIWRLRLKATDAQALNVLYDDFYLASQSVLHIYNEEKTMILGGFTSANNKQARSFATGNVLGESIILELFEPMSDIGQNIISIEKIGYVYRDAFAEIDGELRSGGGQSDFCQVDVACSEANGWEDQEKGVVRILLTSNQGQGWCSGSLVNNTSQDCAPLILTAWHCGEDSSPAQYNQYIYYFNYQASSCGGNSSPGTQSITGSTRLAYSNDGGGNSGSDFLLTELNQDLPSSIDAYFNGWNAINTSSSSGVGIHHPSGDYKKISTNNNNLQSTQWGSASGSHWRVNWVSTANGHGVTEGGSSGSPIFNSNGLIVGQLTGGSSFCNSPNAPDLYGKMSYNWTSNGNQAFEQLKNFLDPIDSGVLTLEGTYAPCTPPVPTGCTDPTALNYDPDAIQDDGSCEYPCLEAVAVIDLTLDCYGSETAWGIADLNEQVLYEVPEGTYAGEEGNIQPGGSSDQVTLCLPPGCYIFFISDSFGDGIAGSLYSNCGVDGDVVISDGLGNILFDLAEPNFGFGGSIEFCIEEIDIDNDGFLASEGDCNDTDPNIYPGAPEICDGLDNNCDGNIDEGFIINTFYLDSDEDGFGDPNTSVLNCAAPNGYVTNSLDCDDADPEVNPNQTEICDGKDNNCDGNIDEGFSLTTYYIDNDNDSYGNPNVSINSCFQPDGYADNPNDCNDTNPNINPGMSEICNGADDNCSGEIDEGLATQIYYEDADNDSYGNPDASIENCSPPNGYVLNSLDCDDSNSSINPAANEIMDDGIDQDCDGNDLVTSISENSVGNVSIYPNPSTGKITITGTSAETSLRLIDNIGRTVWNGQTTQNQDISIDFSELAKGVYSLRLQQKGETNYFRLILE